MHSFFIKTEEWIADFTVKDQVYKISHATEPRCGQRKMLLFLSVYKFHTKY